MRCLWFCLPLFQWVGSWLHLQTVNGRSYLIRYGHKLALKIAVGVLSVILFLPLCLVSFFDLIFNDFGENTVVETVYSPDEVYRAEVIDDDQGALGGSTRKKIIRWLSTGYRSKWILFYKTQADAIAEQNQRHGHDGSRCVEEERGQKQHVSPGGFAESSFFVLEDPHKKCGGQSDQTAL